jgi:hypothetical protein
LWSIFLVSSCEVAVTFSSSLGLVTSGNTWRAWIP